MDPIGWILEEYRLMLVYSQCCTDFEQKVLSQMMRLSLCKLSFVF
jgi:hypothetical protein